VVTARPVVPGRMIVLGTDPATVWWTSGHTPGHGALILKSGDMLTGDLVLEGLTPNVSRVPGGPSDPLAAYLGALATLSGCKCPAVYPARGRVTDVRREATRIAGHHRLRLARTEELLAAPKTVAEVATVLFGLPRLRRVEDQRLALGETLAHLEYLARQGRVIRLVDGVPTDGHRRLEGLLRTASSLSYVVCPTSA
jgi:glyoxylase-like metal-dependent hydrolase (beta-lactamase superfamily II)